LLLMPAVVSGAVDLLVIWAFVIPWKDLLNPTGIVTSAEIDTTLALQRMKRWYYLATT
jgi:hypothetical protein